MGSRGEKASHTHEQGIVRRADFIFGKLTCSKDANFPLRGWSDSIFALGDVDIAEHHKTARFMLIICSAFVNHLIAEDPKTPEIANERINPRGFLSLDSWIFQLLDNT